MTIQEAFEIVLSLARDNIVDDVDHPGDELHEIYLAQVEACNIVEEIAQKTIEEIANFGSA